MSGPQQERDGWIVFRRDIRMGDFPIMIAAFSSPDEMLTWLSNQILSQRSKGRAE